MNPNAQKKPKMNHQKKNASILQVHKNNYRNEFHQKIFPETKKHENLKLDMNQEQETKIF